LKGSLSIVTGLILLVALGPTRNPAPEQQVLRQGHGGQN